LSTHLTSVAPNPAGSRAGTFPGGVCKAVDCIIFNPQYVEGLNSLTMNCDFLAVIVAPGCLPAIDEEKQDPRIGSAVEWNHSSMNGIPKEANLGQ
jgi:hypothetical protein